MDNNRLSFLLKKYHEGKCSEEEVRELHNWYESLNYPADTDDIDEEKMLAELKGRVLAKSKSRNRFVYRYAAVLAGFCLSIGLYFYLYTKKELPPVKEKMAVSANLIKKDKGIIILSDGSRVVLNGESKLLYPETFEGKIREVTLIGEAYFDIARDTHRPFIINSGEVRTRVLGTAFNIKAIPGQQDVVVTVTRGKVQVEDQKAKVLAVLTVDEQVLYNNRTTKAVKKTIDADESISWIQKNMRFESAEFGNIADSLSRIYAVNISFSDAKLKKCLITASFSGVETLEEVLDVLCNTRGAHYQIKDNKVIISGTRCNP